MNGRLTKVSSAALAIAGAPAIGLGIISNGGIIPVVLATVSIFKAQKWSRTQPKKKDDTERAYLGS